MSDNGVPITPEMAKNIEKAALVISSLILEEDGMFKLSGKRMFEVEGYRIEISAKLVNIPFPDIDKKDKQE